MNLKENKKQIIKTTLKSVGMVLLLFLLIMMPSQRIFADEIVRVVRNKKGEWAINEDEKSYMIYRRYKGFKYTRSTKGAIISAYTGKKKKVTVPAKIKGLKVVSISSFKKANNLEEIHIPATVTGELNLSGVRKLKKITIDKDNPVFKVKNNLVLDKSETTLHFCPPMITSVTIPDTVKHIKSEAFARSKIKKLTLPDSVEEIESRAFVQSKVKKINIPASMKEIEFGAFSYSNIEEVVLPDTIEKIGATAFSCSDIKEIIIPESVKEIGYSAFSDCDKLKKVIFKTEQLTQFESNLFSDCTSLEEMKIPDSVTEVGEYAFRGCTSMKKLEVGNKVEVIDYSVVQDCTSLEEVILPASVREIGENEFSDCRNLRRIYIYNGNCSMGYNDYFDEYSEVIPKTATVYSYKDSEVEKHAKKYGLKFVAIPHETDAGYLYSVSEKGVVIEGYNGTEKRLVIPEQLEGKKVIAIRSFIGENNVKELHIPATVTENLDVFGAWELEKITIDKNNPTYTAKNNLIMNKDATIVYGCPWNLSKVIIPNTVKIIEKEAFIHSKIKEVVISKNVEQIKQAAFEDCVDLKKVTFKTKKLRKINVGLFSKCKALKEIKIPASVKKIEKAAFEDCNNLKKIYIYNKNCKFANKKYSIDPLGLYEATIYGYKGSTAEKYAKKSYQPFAEIK